MKKTATRPRRHLRPCRAGLKHLDGSLNVVAAVHCSGHGKTQSRVDRENAFEALDARNSLDRNAWQRRLRPLGGRGAHHRSQVVHPKIKLPESSLASAGDLAPRAQFVRHGGACGRDVFVIAKKVKEALSRLLGGEGCEVKHDASGYEVRKGVKVKL